MLHTHAPLAIITTTTAATHTLREPAHAPHTHDTHAARTHDALTNCTRTLVGRQCPTVRFARVTLVTCAPVADLTRRVYARVLDDWRPEIGVVTPKSPEIGAVTPRSPEIGVSTRSMATTEERLATRARAIGGDDAWFRACEAEYAPHPAFPRPAAVPAGAAATAAGAKRPRCEGS